MEQANKERAVLRRYITVLHKKLFEEKCELSNAEKVKFEDKYPRLFKLDATLKSFTMQLTEEDFENMEQYRDLVLEIKSLVEQEDVRNQKDFNGKGKTLTAVNTNLRLPPLEINNFSGDVEEWVAFWAQFRKIDESNIAEEDKFQYLLQSVRGRAKQLVDSYPPSAGNYMKAVEALKTRFANTNILIDFYVRKLINLMISEINKPKGRTLTELYDELTSNLNNLETLELPVDNYAPILLPLIESCLPVNILQAWERSKLNFQTLHISGSSESLDKQSQMSDKFKASLDGLLAFLKREVEADERINTAKSCLGPECRTGRPTADTLVNNTPTPVREPGKEGKLTSIECIFCSRAHNSQDCVQAQSLDLAERKRIVASKNGCFNCLRLNHKAKSCNAVVRCLLCHDRHFILLCPQLEAAQLNKKSELNTETETESPAMANNTKGTVLLQTLQVNLIGKNRTEKIRCLIDSGSQKSYILQRTAEKLKLLPHGQEIINHNLFGGKSNSISHNKYTVTLQNIKNSYQADFCMLGQNEICASVPRLQNINNLKLKNVVLTDVGKGSPDIDAMIGADMISQILTGNTTRADKNLVAVETLLGWSILGQTNTLLNTVTTTISNLCIDNTPDLCSPDSLSIRDSANNEQVAVEFFGKTKMATKKQKLAADHKKLNVSLYHEKTQNCNKIFNSRFFTRKLSNGNRGDGSPLVQQATDKSFQQVPLQDKFSNEVMGSLQLQLKGHEETISALMREKNELSSKLLKAEKYLNWKNNEIRKLRKKMSESKSKVGDFKKALTISERKTQELESIKNKMEKTFKRGKQYKVDPANALLLQSQENTTNVKSAETRSRPCNMTEVRRASQQDGTPGVAKVKFKKFSLFCGSEYVSDK